MTLLCQFITSVIHDDLVYPELVGNLGHLHPVTIRHRLAHW